MITPQKNLLDWKDFGKNPIDEKSPMAPIKHTDIQNLNFKFGICCVKAEA